MTAPKFPTAAAAKAAGWFSRRHKTSEAHRATQEAWRQKQERKRARGVAE